LITEISFVCLFCVAYITAVCIVLTHSLLSPTEVG
jgi:hypothetical protein